ncbi:MAG: hypothetical protein R3D26_04835 [Cyanobacteriota/Melainabacteria group bacterium]
MPFLANHEYSYRQRNADAFVLCSSVIIGVLISGEDDHLVPFSGLSKNDGLSQKAWALD